MAFVMDGDAIFINQHSCLEYFFSYSCLFGQLFPSLLAG